MLPDESERLLQEVLDGTASDGERARLESWLKSNPAGRDRRTELEILFRELSAVSPAPVPADLRERVIDEIRRRAARPASFENQQPRASRQRTLAGLSLPARRPPPQQCAPPWS